MDGIVDLQQGQYSIITPEKFTDLPKHRLMHLVAGQIDLSPRLSRYSLEETDDRLGEGVIIGITNCADGSVDLDGGEALCVFDG